MRERYQLVLVWILITSVIAVGMCKRLYDLVERLHTEMHGSTTKCVHQKRKQVQGFCHQFRLVQAKYRRILRGYSKCSIIARAYNILMDNPSLILIDFITKSSKCLSDKCNLYKSLDFYIKSIETRRT